MVVFRPVPDSRILHRLIGTALLDDNLCKALLIKRTRSHVLEAYPLTTNSRLYLLSLPDMHRLEDLAEHVYHGLLEPSATA
jgi:hypothetical protein